MPKSCCVPGCTSNRNKHPERQYYTIPIDNLRREKWLAAINRAALMSDGTVSNKLWTPHSASTYVCSVHFISGCKVNNPCHPDYVPTLYLLNKPVSVIDESAKMKRFERASKRKSTDISSISSTKVTKLSSDVKKLPVHIEHGYNRQTVENIKGTETLEESCSSLDIGPQCSYATMQTPMQRPLEPSERESLYMETYNLRCERDIALDNVSFLQIQLDAGSLSSNSVEDNDRACQMMTGISWGIFLKVFLFLKTFMNNKSVTKGSISLRDQFFVTLVKLRHNQTFEFLAHVKGIPKTTMIDYFWKWIDLFFAKLSFMIKWSDRDVIFKTLPPVFKQKFPRLTSIIDCFEIFIEAPRKHLARSKCYSNYKRHTTVKFFISCNPLGSINFLSKGWGGRASDVKIVRESNFINPTFHLPGDQILADRGFTLHDDFAAACGAELITPAFTKGKKQLSSKDLEISRKISSVRIHIERVIGLLKNRYSIVKGIMPIRCVQRLKDESLNSPYASCDKIKSVCAILINLGTSIVYKEEKEE